MISIFLLVIGLAGIAGGVNMVLASKRVRDWPVVPGHVIDKGVRPPTSTRAGGTGAVLEVWVKYAYTVDGKPYVGERMGLNNALPSYDPDQARRKAQAFPDAVEVHYNPRDPGDAYLEGSAYGMAIIAFAVGIACVLISAGVYFYSGKR